MPPRDPARVFQDLDEAISRQVAQWPDRASGFDNVTRLTRELADHFLDEAPDPDGQEPRGEAAAVLRDHAVFIGGSPKGGTTMLLQLFDGHSDCVTIPHDSRTVHLLAEPAESRTARALLPELLRKAISPNALPPFWNLGREVEPYRRLAHAYRRWNGCLSGQPGGALLAAAMALAEASGRTTPTHLVEKTCANVLHPDRMFQAFPRARMIHILRDPYATLPALARQTQVRGWDWTFRARLEHVREYLAAAAENPPRFGPDRYRVVRYETLVAQAEPVMRDLAAWVGLEFQPILTTPTVLGHPAESNSMFGERRVTGALLSESRTATEARWVEAFGPEQRAEIVEAIGELAEGLGYPPPGVRASTETAA